MTDEQKAVMQPGNDPFEMSRFNGSGVPAEPIQYSGNLFNNLLNNDEVDEKVRQKYWPIFHKDNTLTFLDEPRKASKMLNFDIMMLGGIKLTPYRQYDFALDNEQDAMRNIFETKLDRAMGVKTSNILNERKALGSSFSENRQISEQNGGVIHESFIKKLLRKS